MLIPAASEPSRRSTTRQRVLKATAEILERDGYSELTMERVAALSGSAKTTLYRHWPTRAALCMDLYLELAAGELRDPESGDVATDLKELAQRVIHLQTQTPAGPALIGLIAEAQRDAHAATLLKAFAKRRREITRTVLKRAIERVQVRADVDIDIFIDALGGAVTFRLLQGHAPLNKQFTDKLVDQLLLGTQPT